MTDANELLRLVRLAANFKASFDAERGRILATDEGAADKAVKLALMTVDFCRRVSDPDPDMADYMMRAASRPTVPDGPAVMHPEVFNALFPATTARRVAPGPNARQPRKQENSDRPMATLTHGPVPAGPGWLIVVTPATVASPPTASLYRWVAPCVDEEGWPDGNYWEDASPHALEYGGGRTLVDTIAHWALLAEGALEA